MEFAGTTTTLLAIGDWQQCGKLIFSALENGWSVLYSSRSGDIPTALKGRKIELILLAGCSTATGWERVAQELGAASGGAAMVVLVEGTGQDLLISALVGTRSWSGESGRDQGATSGQAAALPAAIADSVRQSVLTPTLSLLEPVYLQVTAEMRRALEFIESHFAEPISLADAAKAASYSRCHFCKLFKQQLGLSFVSYLSRVRIRHAMDLLGRSGESITDIAFEVGFNDLSHFERVFRSVQGKTPSQFRQIAKQSPSGWQDPPSETPFSVAPCRVSTLPGLRRAADDRRSCQPRSQLSCRPKTDPPVNRSTPKPGSKATLRTCSISTR
jgi:AraC-like DNA-binding protein